MFINRPGVHGKQKAWPSRFCTNPKAQSLQLSLPNVPTFIENLPLLHLVQDDSAAAPLSSRPYFPGMQLMQTDSFSAPISELHFPLGHPLQSILSDPSNSENLPLVQFLHPSRKFFACSVLPINPRGQDKHAS
jgi:hypothetical protein